MKRDKLCCANITNVAFRKKQCKYCLLKQMLSVENSKDLLPIFTYSRFLYDAAHDLGHRKRFFYDATHDLGHRKRN